MRVLRNRIFVLLPGTLWLIAVNILVAQLSGPLDAQVVLKNEDVTFRFGVQGQLWGDWTQDSTGNQGYQQNFYLRRARLIAGGDIGNDISFFFETDDPKLGITPKNLSAGFIIQDALMEWRPSKVLQVVGGEMIVPFTRNGLQSTATYMALDISPISTVTNSVTQCSALRDLGFELKGFFLNDRLSYRIGEFSGERDVNAHDSLRTTGYVQYDFFGKETGYLFRGTALGKEKVLAVDGGFDVQGGYHGLSGNVATMIPIHEGDEIASQFQYIRYDGGIKFPTIEKQNDYLVEAAYYIHKYKIQPFAKYDSQNFTNTADLARNIHRTGGGVNYYIRGQNLKWTVQYQRAVPSVGSLLKPGNEMTAQLQLFYY